MQNLILESTIKNNSIHIFSMHLRYGSRVDFLARLNSLRPLNECEILEKILLKKLLHPCKFLFIRESLHDKTLNYQPSKFEMKSFRHSTLKLIFLQTLLK